jgi:hypothetical protein
MKKLSLLTLLVFLLASCSDEIIHQTVEPNTYTNTYRIFANEMQKRVDPAGTYFEYAIREPNLTDEIFDYGILQAFLYYEKDGQSTLCPLPFSDFLIMENGYQWEEHFTVEFQPGVIKFIQKISDHATDAPVSEYYDVLVRFLW